MALFGSMMRDFDHDPYFPGPFNTMRRMEAMMNGMMSPLDNMLAPPTMGRNMLMPFGFGHSLFPNMGNNMFADFQSVAQAPHCHSYSSSSIMSFTTDESGRPQVYQSTSSMRTAPGGVKETHKTYQDTTSGVQSMAIGHHMGEKAHIIEKAKNRFTGEENENQEFINLEEEEAPAFNEEWQSRVNTYSGARRQGAIGNRNYAPQQTTQFPAITAAPSHSERPPRPRKRDSPTLAADGHTKHKKRNALHNLKMKGNYEKSKHAKN